MELGRGDLEMDVSTMASMMDFHGQCHLATVFKMPALLNIKQIESHHLILLSLKCIKLSFQLRIGLKYLMVPVKRIFFPMLLYLDDNGST